MTAPLKVVTIECIEHDVTCLNEKGIYKNCEPFTDQLQPIYFACNGLQTKPIGFKYKLSKVWRIMLCNTMKA